MNSLFNTALKQSAAVRRDLDSFYESPVTVSPALLGQISTSLTSFARTVDDYSTLSKKELIAPKKEKAFERVKTFRTELADYRQLFGRLKNERTEAAAGQNEVLGRRPHHTSTPENPYAQATTSTGPYTGATGPYTRPGAGSQGLSFGTDSSQYGREEAALREQSFFSTSNMQLDEFLERGRAVLGDLGEQREILKNTQRRLYSVANTLGLSGDTIRTINRRAREDRYIFFGGVAVFIIFVWLVLHFLR